VDVHHVVFVHDNLDALLGEGTVHEHAQPRGPIRVEEGEGGVLGGDLERSSLAPASAKPTHGVLDPLRSPTILPDPGGLAVIGTPSAAKASAAKRTVVGRQLPARWGAVRRLKRPAGGVEPGPAGVSHAWRSRGAAQRLG
jgi:hypothetical protein